MESESPLPSLLAAPGCLSPSLKGISFLKLQVLSSGLLTTGTSLSLSPRPSIFLLNWLLPCWYHQQKDCSPFVSRSCNSPRHLASYCSILRFLSPGATILNSSPSLGLEPGRQIPPKTFVGLAEWVGWGSQLPSNPLLSTACCPEDAGPDLSILKKIYTS